MTEKQDLNRPATRPATSDLLLKLGTSREVRNLVGSLVPEIMRVWSESGTGAGPATRTTRKGIAKIAGNSIKNAFLDKQGMNQAPLLHQLATDPAVAKDVGDQIQALLDATFEIGNGVLDELKTLDLDKKEAVLGSLLSGISQGRSGDLLTRWCRMAIDVHVQDPDFLSRTLHPGFEKWVQNLDFGELKEYFDTAAPGLSNFIKMINTVMWDYPAKFISLLALLPTFTNIAADGLLQTLQMMNRKAPPDLLADSQLAMMQEIDNQILANLTNELTEVFRKIHTGSALIGEPGSPELPKALTHWLTGFVEALNGETLWKARTAMAEIKEAGSGAFAEVMANHPELAAEGIKTKSAARNAALRTLNKSLTTLEDLGQEEAVNAAMGKAAEDLDIQEAAESLNAAAMIINRLCETQEPILAEKAAAFADALDTYEISDALTQVGKTAGNALLPIARTVAPHLISGFLTALAPADDDLEEDVQSARDKIGAFLNSMMEED